MGKYNAVGYLQISPEVMHEDVATIYEQQKAIGYESEFIEGEKECTKYMKGMFDDWQAQGITSVLHEKQGGYAFNKASVKALEEKSTTNGVNIIKGVKVTGFKRGSNSKAVTGVETDKGIIECEQVVVGAGPFVRDFWNMLELPKVANIKGPAPTTTCSHSIIPLSVSTPLTALLVLFFLKPVTVTPLIILTPFVLVFSSRAFIEALLN